MPVSDQILMTLMKLRLNLVGGDLARRFNISSGYVSTILSFWIKTLAAHLSEYKNNYSTYHMIENLNKIKLLL